LLNQVLIHGSAELEDRAFDPMLPPGDSTASFGYLVKACKIWGEITRWIFCEYQEPLSSILTDNRITPAFHCLVQWESELPQRCKWNFENYTAHSIPGAALGSSFLFMHLVGRIGFVLLGLNALSRASEQDLVGLMTSSNNGGTAMAPAPGLVQVITKVRYTVLN
jgi:hypothetical protein